MGAALVWARAQRRRNRASVLALMILVGLSSGVALTAFAGARRSDTAYERLLETSAAADARVQYASSRDIDDEVLTRLRADEGVEAAAPVWFTVGFSEASDYDIGVVHSPDPAFMRDIDRLRLSAGRLPGPRSTDEVVAGEFLADEIGLEVGDQVTLGTFSQDQLEEFAFDEPLGGPSLELQVVGIGSSPDDLSSEQNALLFAGPGYYEATASRAGRFGPSIQLRVRDGADVDEIVATALDGLPLDEAPLVEHAATRADRIQDAMSVLAFALAVFGACAGLAALVAGGQAISRLLSSFAEDQVPLRAMGFTRPQRFVAAVLAAAPIAVGGAVLATLVAVAASPAMPIGLARRAEPSPGVDVDPAVLSVGAVAVALLVAIVASLSSWRLAAGRTSSWSDGARARRSLGSATAARAGWSAPAVLGITMALEPGRGRTAVPVRPALVGSVVGIAGVVAALTFGASLDRLVSTPSAYGWSWSIAPDLFEGDAQTVAALPEVDEVGTLLFHQTEVEGQQLHGVAVLPVEGAPSLTVLDGRMPASIGEVALGPETASQLGTEIGDQVAMTSTDEDLHLTVVGTVLFPVFDENAFNEGVAFHPDLAGDIALSDGFGRAIVGFAPGVSDEEGAAAVTAALPDSMTVYAFPRRPEDVENLARVAGVPSALAAFLVLVAVAAVAHALVTSVRRRARDLGIVRSLGFVRRDVMASVAVQSVTLVVVGVAFGVPLGVALGRVVWSAVAGGLGVPAVPQVPSLGLALVVIGAIGAAMVVAAWPARHAATRAPAHVLRAE